MSWRKHKTHREETKAVKDALARAGIKASVCHGSGTAWAWLDIHPIGTWTEQQRARARRIIMQVTGRHGDHGGEVLIHYN